MKFLVVVLACVAFALGDHASGFRVRWTSTQNAAGYFIDVPENVADVQAADWSLFPRYDGLFLDMDMYCYKNEVSFCAFYDIRGYVRGYQIALLKEAYSGPIPLNQLGFTSWKFNYNDYWTIQQWFINDASQTTWDATKLLQQDAVYVPTPTDPNTLMEITSEASALEGSLFSKQGCVATKGTHYFYDVLEDCDNLLPWYFLYDGQELVGSGWWVFGSYQLSAAVYGPTVDVFEHETSEFLKNMAPNVNACMVDNFENFGLMSVNVFYVEDFSEITC